MSDLVKRLAASPQRLLFGSADQAHAERVAELRAAIDRKYVLLRFADTRGGTELGVPLDESACELSQADFASGEGTIRLEGALRLDYVRVRMTAQLELRTLEGEGQLHVL